MKRIIVLSLLIVTALWSAELPFHRGVNLTGWFQTSSAQQIQFTKFTRQDFVNIKNLGCDVIRLPVNLHFMTGGPPDYIVDPLFYYFFDQVVDFAEELKLHLILDNHTFDPSESTDPDIGDALIPVWTQIAEHYKNRSTYLYYEVLNEPHDIADAVWNTTQQEVIDVIRQIDQTHTIIIGPAGWNSYNNLRYMPEYTDDNLIYTFHYYDPFLFTHQGAGWTDPSMAPLSGVPFPYDASRMPDLPPELAGSWIESSYNNYQNEGTVEHVKQLIDIAAAFQFERNATLLCGELGVYIPNSNNEDRVYWYDAVRKYLEEKNIAWTMWDYKGSFGLFEAGSNELFDYDLNIPLVEALGFNVPPQFQFVLEPDTTGFDLYMDYIGTKILESSWTANGTINYYSEDNPAAGSYCIYWTEADQYGYIGFNFNPIKDLTLLVDHGYAFDFYVRGKSPGARFDIRFIDTKTDEVNDHPWRMTKTIDETMATWDGDWNHLQIPLNEFSESGSWDNDTWFEPQGDFDWAAVQHFQIVAEHHSLEGIKFWFDNIRIIDPQAVGIQNQCGKPHAYQLYQNYPNPFNPETTIRFEIPSTEKQMVKVELHIYNLQGQVIRTLINDEKLPGVYQIKWDGLDKTGKLVATGIYFYRIHAGKFTSIRKMILIN